jgi:uncharacterized protein DUF4956
MFGMMLVDQPGTGDSPIQSTWDFLKSSVHSSHDLDWKATGIRLGAAVVFGIAIALIHVLFRRRDSRQPGGLGTSLILLTVIVAFVIFVIGDSPARAFGLVGALSIIRFRTSVTDTRDTSFVIFAVAIGMALGAGYFVASLVALPVVAAVCAIVSLLGPVVGPGGRLKVRANSAADAEAALNEMTTMIRWRKMQAGGSSKKDGGMEFVYAVILKPGSEPSILLDKLRQRPGVLRVSWASR